MIKRTIEKKIKEKLFRGKAIILTGPRQVGKTTLINKIINDAGKSILFLNGDDPAIRTMMTSPNTEQLKQILGNAELIFVDEAQRIQNIGLTGKIIIDQFKEKQLILSGSSSFEHTQETHEPLTGRKWSFHLWPVSWEEWELEAGYVKAEQDLENRLIYGFYPDVLNHPEEQAEVLRALVDSYLYKDILSFGGIRKPQVIQKLVQALAYQAGSEVSYKEIGDLIGADPKTVESYIDVLEKGFVIFRLPAFSRNLRNEIKRNRKIYFWDNGVRNAVVSALQPFAGRQDIGILWENFLVSERIKQNDYKNTGALTYFWRTKQQQEVDFVEDLNGKIYGFEFKWNLNRKVRFPGTFLNAYDPETKVVSRENFKEFLK